MPLPSENPAIVRRTQILDVLRALPSGLMSPLEGSIILTIAIKVFAAPSFTKSLIPAASGVGLLVSPFLTAWARRSQLPVMKFALRAAVVGSLGFVAALHGSLLALVFGATIAISAVNSVIPLNTYVYDRNFPEHERGRRVGWGMTLRVCVAAAAGLLMGEVLNTDLALWPYVMAVGLVATILYLGIFAGIPSEPLPIIPGVTNRPWPHFELLKADRQLAMTLGAWMLMGFGNLMVLPLRVEYLAQPKYGINASAGKIAWLTVVIPSIVRLICTPIFATVFDRLSFFAARILVNVFFGVYIAAFFTGTSNAGLAFGAIALGIGTSGGDLMWTLWVTKFAPPGRVTDYMGLHTFFTGIRGVFAPILGFFVIQRLPLQGVAVIAALLTVGASLILVPEMRAERARRAEVAGA